MSQTALRLESFGDDPATAPQISAQYEDGYAAGFEAGQQAAAQTAGHLDAELVQALSDIAFTYSAGRREFTASLTSLVTTLTQTVLPHCVASGFAAQVADAILRTFAPLAGTAIIVHVHPDQVVGIKATTNQIAAEVTVIADPSLSPHAAWIGQAGQEVQIDMDRHLADISALLSNLTPQQNGNAHHG